MRTMDDIPQRPRGQALAELAILLPVLIILVLGATDYARVYRHFMALESAATTGAQYGCVDASHALDANGIRLAAMRQLQDITHRNPVVASHATNGVLTVKVTATFSTVFRWPGMPGSNVVTRGVQMRILR